MKYLFLLLVLAGCGKAETETKQEAIAEPPAQPAPPLDVDLSLEAFTNYAKYFKQSPRYPFILLKDGKIDSNPGEWEGTNRHLPVKFKNTGKVLAYTNDLGGVIINDEEILVTADELEKIYDTNLPFFTEEEYPSWTVDADRQNRLYSYIYDHGLRDLKKIKPLSEGKKYLKFNSKFPPKTPKSIRYINQMIRAEYIDMILSALNPKDQEKVAWYFDSTPDKNWGYFVRHKNTSNEILWIKWERLVAETLVFDTPEKTRIRMLNFLALDFVEYHYYLYQPDIIIDTVFLYVTRDFKF